MKAPDLIVAAGGTGGHIMPALAVLEALPPEMSVQWWGAKGRMEETLVPQHQVAFRGFAMSGARGKGVWGRVAALAQAAWTVCLMLLSLLRHRPKVILGMGGFTAGPAGVAAWILRIPLIIHEQNAISGRTNRALYRLAQQAYASYPGSLGQAPAIGNPVRREIRDIGARAEKNQALRVLVLGGSQGARALNTVLPRVFGALSLPWQLHHQCGKGQAQAVQVAYQQAGVEAQVSEFIHNMAWELEQCDLLISRAGATTVAELIAARRPAVLVPYPHAVDDHQRANAAALSEVGGAWLVDESELESQLNTLLPRLQTQGLGAARAALAQWQSNNAHQVLAEAIKRYCRWQN